MGFSTIAQLNVNSPSYAQGASGTVIVGRVPVLGVVTGVTYFPNADMVGADTNTRKISVVNKKRDGNGAVEIASMQFNAGVNATDFNQTSVALTQTAANLEVVPGDVLVFESTKLALGLADAGGMIQVTISRR